MKSVAFGEADAFEKMPKESFGIENSPLKQLEFSFNHAMFIFPQFKLADNFQDDEALKSFKMKFHIVLRKKEEEIWSMKKTMRLISISKDAEFEILLQNHRYKVIKADNSVCGFTIVDFTLMNLNDVITLASLVEQYNDGEIILKPLVVVFEG